MPTLLAFLNYFGITADKITPLVILALLGMFYLSKTLKPINKKIGRCCNAIIEIQTTFKNQGIDLDHKMTETSASPLKPTTYGAELIKDSGLEKMLNDNKELLNKKLQASLPEGYTHYDVQEKARELLISLTDDPIMSSVKTWIYNNPIDIDIILSVGGLWLRDDFLKEPRLTSKK